LIFFDDLLLKTGMKFVFVSYVRSPEFNRPEDWIKRIHAYLGVLESLSKQHTVTSIEQINYKGDLQKNGVQYHFMDFGKPKLYFPWKLHQFIKTLDPDIILVHGIDFPWQVIQLRLKMGRRARIIVQSHGKQTPKGYKRILQRIADKCINAYFFTSKKISEAWLKEGLIVNEKKIYEVMVGSSIFYPIGKEKARLENKIDGTPTFLWAGRLDENKDPLTVIKAFLRFRLLSPGAKLYMVYQTNELLQDIEYLLEKHISKDAIVLVGKTSHADMLQWFNSADFFISGSHFEVFGAALSEAMSCGCIPVVTNIPSFQKITGDRCGIQYHAGDEEALFAALLQTVQMDMVTEREKVQQQFEQHLSFDAIAHTIQSIAISL
jgi:glycosyltransferase involved in cell wall biosynthesis